MEKNSRNKRKTLIVMHFSPQNIQTNTPFLFCIEMVKINLQNKTKDGLVKRYRVNINKNDPKVTLNIPADILRDLALRSEENGTTIETELALRLARSLERDLKMIAQDNQLAFQAFEKVNAYFNK
jgi:hypothetical protein